MNSLVCLDRSQSRLALLNNDNSREAVEFVLENFREAGPFATQVAATLNAYYQIGRMASPKQAKVIERAVREIKEQLAESGGE